MFKIQTLKIWDFNGVWDFNKFQRFTQVKEFQILKTLLKAKKKKKEKRKKRERVKQLASTNKLIIKKSSIRVPKLPLIGNLMSTILKGTLSNQEILSYQEDV